MKPTIMGSDIMDLIELKFKKCKGHNANNLQIMLKII